MKIHAHDSGRSPGRNRFATLLAGLGATLFAVLPAAWGEHGHSGGGGSAPNGPLSAGGDETVGTLPVVGGGRIDLPFTRGWRGIEPAFSMEGLAGDLMLAIRGARGRGFVSYEVLDEQTGRIRLAFHGDVLVTFDRELATNLPIDFGLAVPPSYGEARFAIALGSERFRGGRLRPGVLPLPVAALSAANVLDEDPLRVRTGNSGGLRTFHGISATDELLVLRQAD